MSCDILTGFITFVAGLAMYFFTHFLIYLDRTEQILGGQVFRVFLVIHCMGWVSQFIGHGVYEQRAPALLTNSLFAFIAPFFCTFELLNIGFGYKEDVKKECDLVIESDIAWYRLARGYQMRPSVSVILEKKQD